MTGKDVQTSRNLDPLKELVRASGSGSSLKQKEEVIRQKREKNAKKSLRLECLE